MHVDLDLPGYHCAPALYGVTVASVPLHIAKTVESGREDTERGKVL